MRRWFWLILAYWLTLPAWAAPQGPLEYYIGVDGLETLSSGTYAGLTNPNRGRLTLLFNHGDHFHGIGAFSYAGPVESLKIMSTNTNNRIPETYSGQPPLALTPGSGTWYSGKLVSNPSEAEYSHLTLGSVQALRFSRSGSVADLLFHSSNDRWIARFPQARIALQLVSKTEGLHIGTQSKPEVLQHPGDFVILGHGVNRRLKFTPVFWTEGDAPSGTHSAEFRLLDLHPNPKRRVLPSGTFSFDFSVP